jgi:hypothetical protein
MKCHDLANSIEKLQPDAQPSEVARLCLLLSNYVDDLDELIDEERLSQVWQDLMIRLTGITDQHSAMTAELEDLSSTKPDSLTLDQILVLIRAIKVQSQVVQLYTGFPVLNAG